MLAYPTVLLEVFPLEVFPESGLSRSIITTVLVGLVFAVLFHEWFGWVLSGLVVPGYLAPIFLIQPWSGAVIVVEAVLTHIVVSLLSGPLNRLGWRAFFGRDRFFAYLLFGTLIRAVLEGYALRAFGAWLNETLGFGLDYRNSFYSIGLIVVPLLANTFYKPGLLRGLIPTSVLLGLCYAAIRWVLIPLTNFSIADFELSYGYYATSFLGNAKAYIILLTSAFLASRTNLLYGWDYNGILVPSLLALAWFTPTKVIATLAEAVLILHLTRWLTARRLFRNLTIEGGRKLLLCFGVGFALKLGLGFWVGAYYPGLDATELYGFGYLLPSLIAAKMWQRDSAALVLRPLVQTSLVGALGGSLLTTALLAALPPGFDEPAPSQLTPSQLVRTLQGDLLDTLRADKARLVRRSDPKGVDRPYGAEHAALRHALERVREAQARGPAHPETPRLLAAAALALRTIDYELVHLRDPNRGAAWYLVRESADAPGALHGWGLYAFAVTPRSELVLEVPRPLAEWKALEAAAALLELVDGRALLVAGAHPLAGRTGEADALALPGGPFQTAHLLHAGHDILSVRGDPEPALRARERATDPQEPPPAAGTARLYVERRLPSALDLQRLRQLIGGTLELRLPGTGRYEERNQQRRTAQAAFVTLVLHPRAAEHLVAQYYRSDSLKSEADLIAIDGYLLHWVQQARQAIAPTGSEAFQPPSVAELLYMDDEVLTPILALQRAAREGELDLERVRQVARAAGRLHYELIHYTYRLTGERFLILREREPAPGALPAAAAPRARFGGTFVFRLGPSRPFVIEVPYPVTDLYTFEAGARLLELLRAQALIVSGSSRHANADGRGDVAAPRNAGTFFQLAHQVLCRESGGQILAVQLRGFASAVRPGLDVVLSTGKEIRRRTEIPGRVLELERELVRLRAQLAYVDGSLDMLPFQVPRGPQWHYSEVYYPGSFVTCWLSREMRDRLRGRLATRRDDELALPDLGLPQQRGNLLVHLAGLLERWRQHDRTTASRPAARPHAAVAAVSAECRAASERTVARLEDYAASRNVLYLDSAVRDAALAGGRLVHFLDASSAREYLVYEPPAGMPEVVVVLDLYPSVREAIRVEREGPAVEAALSRFTRHGYERLHVLQPRRLAPGGLEPGGERPTEDGR